MVCKCMYCTCIWYVYGMYMDVCIWYVSMHDSPTAFDNAWWLQKKTMPLAGPKPPRWATRGVAKWQPPGWCCWQFCRVVAGMISHQCITVYHTPIFWQEIAKSQVGLLELRLDFLQIISWCFWAARRAKLWVQFLAVNEDMYIHAYSCMYIIYMYICSCIYNKFCIGKPKQLN